jgi:curved DNA-binding protein CbpA
MSMDEYYKILGLQPGASIQEVKAARNEMLEVWHPDRFQHKPDLARKATEQTKQINNAYDNLIKHLKNNRQSHTQSKKTYSNSKSKSDTQAEYERRAESERQQKEKAEYERQHKEKAEQERIAKERKAERERLAKEKAEQETIRQNQKKRLIKIWLFAGGFILLLLVSVFLLPVFQSSRESTKSVKGSHTEFQTDIIDELNGSSFGDTYGITYVDALNGQGANFSRQTESRIEYPNNIPSEGTLEWWIYVRSGYHYSDFRSSQNQSNALIFTTVGGDVWYPGSTWFNVQSNGKLSLNMATTKYDGPTQLLIAPNTNFRFNQWHSIGISFGRDGQYIMLDGVLVASAPQNTQKLGRGGTHESSIDIPTVGELVSGFWVNNQYDAGFEGIIDRFRISNKQQDWYLSLQSPR